MAAGARSKPADPLGIASLVFGSVAMGLSVILWLQRLRPSMPLAGYGYELSHGGMLWEQVVWLIGTLGLGAILAGFLSTAGGRARWTATVGVMTGTVACVYPALVLFGYLDAPLRPVLF